MKFSSLSVPKVTIKEVEEDTDSEDSEGEDRTEIYEDLIGDSEFGLSRQDKLQLRRNNLKKTEERRLRREKRQKRRDARKEQIEARDSTVKQRRAVLDSIDDATISRDYEALASSIEIASQVGLCGGNRRRQWCVRKVYDAEKLLQTLREEREAAEAVARANRQFQSKMLACQVRTEPLGMDRDFNTFWRFGFDEKKIRIFVHNVKNKTWQYYSRAKDIKLLHDSLDRRGVRERALRENLKDYLDSLKYDDAEEEEEEEEDKMDVEEDEKNSIAWKSQGPFMGRHVRRVFDNEPSDAVVTGYVSEDGEDCALWHVRHLDGDEEDLEKYELDEAIAQYDTNDVDENASYVTYVNGKVKRDKRADAMSSSDLQSSLQNLTLRVGQSLVFALKERKSEWAVTSKRLKSSNVERSNKSTYIDWKDAVLKSQSIAEFRSLILDLEKVVHETQESPDRPKFTEWRVEGHEVIGKRIRHFFEKNTGSLSSMYHIRDGKVIAWKPADEDNEDLFKIKFDENEGQKENEESSKMNDSEEEGDDDEDDDNDKDEENWNVSELEVDEEELKRDMGHHQDNAKVPTKRWHDKGPYVGKKTRRFFNVHGIVDGKIIGYQPPRDGNKALWHVRHDDGDEEDLEEFEVKWAIEAKNKDEKEGWITIDSRDYWIGKRAIHGDVEGRVVAAWLPKYEDRLIQVPLWCFMHDDGDCEDLEQYEVDAACDEWEALHSDDKDDEDDITNTTDTLWPYLEAREHWKACVLSSSSYSLLNILVDAFEDHAALYGMTESYSSGKKSNKRSAIGKLVKAWYHSPSSSQMTSSRTKRALNRSKRGKGGSKKKKKKK